MWEDAQKVYFLGVQVYGFGLYAALGAGVALIVLGLILRKAGWKKGTAALTGVLSMAVGFVSARLFLCFLAQNDLSGPMPFQGIFMVTAGGYSMMGALLGASMGAVFASRITRQPDARLLDYLAPCLMLFVACERLGEAHAEELFGVSWELRPDSLFSRSFLAVQDGSGSSFLAVYLLESFTALILALLLLRDLVKKNRSGSTYLLMMLLFGGTQIVFESLRSDGHMISSVNSFVKVQQVIALLLLLSAVIVLCRRRGMRKKQLLLWLPVSLALCGGICYGLFYLTRHHPGSTAVEALIYIAAAAVPVGMGIFALAKRRYLAPAALSSVLVTIGLCVGMEFGIDGAPVSKWLLYVLYIAAVAVPVTLGLCLRKDEEKRGQA